MIGASGEVIEFGSGQGWATVEGERWQVRAAQPLHTGQRVRVTRVDGLTLEVSPIPEPASTQGVSR
jgi:membrane-bound serine protease (ClpP class)